VRVQQIRRMPQIICRGLAPISIRPQRSQEFGSVRPLPNRLVGDLM
jgi:hypothetical protein